MQAAVRLHSCCSALSKYDLPQVSLQAGANKAKPKAKKTTKPLQPATAHNEERAVEDIYQKKTQLEHILLRPDTYIGSTEKQQQKMWVHTVAGLSYSDIEYVPGLYKIFDEILVNAADNKVRDSSMDTVRVDIDPVGARLCKVLIVACESCSLLEKHFQAIKATSY